MLTETSRCCGSSLLFCHELILAPMDGGGLQHLWTNLSLSHHDEHSSGQACDEVRRRAAGSEYPSLHETASEAVRHMDEAQALLEMLNFCLSCYLGDLDGVMRKVMESRFLAFQHLNMGSLALRGSDFALLGLRDGQDCQRVVDFLEAQETMILRSMAQEDTIP